MIYVFPTNPAALGIVLQPDHTADPVSLLSNITAALGTGVKFNALEFEGIKLADGTVCSGNVYIGQFDMDITTGVGVIKTLKPGVQWSFGNERDGNVFDPERLFLQTDNDNDGAQIRGITR